MQSNLGPEIWGAREKEHLRGVVRNIWLGSSKVISTVAPWHWVGMLWRRLSVSSEIKTWTKLTSDSSKEDLNFACGRQKKNRGIMSAFSDFPHT